MSRFENAWDDYRRERREAADADLHHTVRIGTQRRDADELPDRSDLEDR